MRSASSARGAGPWRRCSGRRLSSTVRRCSHRRCHRIRRSRRHRSGGVGAGRGRRRGLWLGRRLGRALPPACRRSGSASSPWIALLLALGLLRGSCSSSVGGGLNRRRARRPARSDRSLPSRPSCQRDRADLVGADHEVVPDLGGEGAAGDGLAAVLGLHRLGALGVADPHRDREVVVEADEPCVLVVLGRSRSCPRRTRRSGPRAPCPR